MDDDTLFALVAVERRRAADMFAALDEQQLASPSLCSAWSARDMAGHLALPFAVSLPKVMVGMLRHRGNFGSYSAKASREVGSRPVSELVRMLRGNAQSRWTPPGKGALAPLSDLWVHVRDVARPLDLDVCAPLAAWRAILEGLFSAQARSGTIPRQRAQGFAVHATDLGESWGHGLRLAGPTEALVMALAGRSVALDDLTGDGVVVLRPRL
ncbi:MAG: hypothetical protein K0Q93_616 [Nocardioidaceae bacterium]|nr:hypothetical protein [Nocardioidaceae bacterium]